MAAVHPPTAGNRAAPRRIAGATSTILPCVLVDMRLLFAHAYAEDRTLRQVRARRSVAHPAVVVCDEDPHASIVISPTPPPTPSELLHRLHDACCGAILRSGMAVVWNDACSR